MMTTPQTARRRQQLPEAMEMTSKDINQQILNDNHFPHIEDQLKINISPSVSGMNDFDYASNQNKMVTMKKVPLPNELISQFSNMQANCAMGIFPEINRAWLTIDSDIYFWLYEDGSDIAYYDGIKEVILAVRLIAPKTGVFQDHIQYLLCITTPLNVHLLGVTFTQNPSAQDMFGSIQLIPEPLFTVASDNVYMTAITSTSNGRIFMAGKNSSLYELVYNVKSGWMFSNKRCYMVNHSASKLSYIIPTFLSFAFSADDPIEQFAMDNTRGFLYCRTLAGNIKMYSLGENLSAMNFVTAVSGASASKQAQYMLRTVDRRNFDKIVHIAPIPNTDSVHIHLVAFTSTGVRLYFSTTADMYASSLRLVHVRMPPGFAPSISPEKPANIHAAYYRQGMSIIVGGVSVEVDRLWYFSQDFYPFNVPIKEIECAVSMEGRAWCLTEIADYANESTVPYRLFCTVPDPPSIITQHIFPPRRFILLNAQGTHIMTTLRPLEKLKNLLSKGNIESEELSTFFQQYGVEQACAVCLILICQHSEAELYIADFAVQAFFLYGSRRQPANNNIAGNIATSNTYIAGSPVRGGSSQGSFLSTPIRQGYGSYPPTPAVPDINSTITQAGVPMNQTVSPTTHQQSAENNKRSAKYNAIIIYFSRVMKPLWNLPMVYECVENNKMVLRSRVTGGELSWFTEKLHKLKRFIDSYSDVTQAQSPTYVQRYSLHLSAGVGEGDALEERRRLQMFHRQLTITIEALGLWKVLDDHSMHIVVEDAPQNVKEKLKHLPVKDLFSVTGRELSCCLINVLTEKYLHDNSAIETLSTQLRHICPTIYSADDALCTKANEVVMSASLLHNQQEKEKVLQEALMMYSKISSLVDLKWVTHHLKANNYYKAIVQLCLTTAINEDPTGIALHYYKSGQPNHDLEGSDAFNIREESYRCIVETLEELLMTSAAHPATPHLPTWPGPPVCSDGMSAEQAHRYYTQMLSNSLKSGDELYHVVLYAWLVKVKQTDQLLEIKSPFLEQYFISTAADQHPNNEETLNLLWKYYEKNNKYLDAAKVLLKLAERQGSMMTISKRLECLSRSVMCAKSITHHSEILHELQEKLDVAHIQLKVFDQLSNMQVASRKVEDALASLNHQLFDVSTLYGDFAEEFGLSVCKLAIIQCAGHADTKLVHTIWLEIIDDAFKKCSHLAPSDRLMKVSEQLINDGSAYVNSEQYFPLDLVLCTLEGKSCELDGDHIWAFTTLLDIGVPSITLFSAYHALFNSKDNTWKKLGKPLHLLNVISLLLVHLLEHPPTITREKLSFTRRLYEACTLYLVELESLDINHPQVRALLPRFKGIQAKLKRAL